MGRCFIRLLGLAFLLFGSSVACSNTTPDPITASIFPNLAQARDEGFHLLAGHPPFTVDFRGETEGGSGTLSYAWDLDEDGTLDSNDLNPGPFIYTKPGEYAAKLRVSDESGQQRLARQRIVVIGEPQRPGWRFGVTTHFTLGEEHNAETERTAQMIQEAGIEAVRIDLAWATVQPDSRDRYDWRGYDYLVSLSREYRFDLLPIIDYSSPWASTAKDASDEQTVLFSPPVPTEYAWFAYKAAERYKADISGWQIWNEPNLSKFWEPEPEPAAYTDLLKHAYLAVKYADPEAVVILGGLSNDNSAYVPEYVWYEPEKFLQRIYDEGGAPYFDAVGRHPYTYPYQGTDALIMLLDDLRSVMVANGDSDKSIWLTEYGVPVSPATGVSGEEQGEWLVESFDALSSLEYVANVFWYKFRDSGSDPNESEHNVGLLEEDLTVKPSYETYSRYISKNPRGGARRGDDRIP